MYANKSLIKMKKKMKSLDAPFYLRKRYYVVIWLFIGHILMALVSVNLNICIVDLTSSKTIVVGNNTYIQAPEYDWSPPQKGLILSALFWGYVASPVGAIVANKFGGVSVFGFSIFLIGLLTTLSPILIHWNLYVFGLARAFEGFLQGVCAASAFTCFVKWVPFCERARLVNFTLLGFPAGAALSYPIVGFINHYSTWKFVFYITGGVTILWFTILYFTIKNSPLEDTFITKRERAHFKEVCEEIAQDKVTIPWKSLLTSIPVLAYWNDRFVESWTHSFFYTCLPLYIKDIYPANIKDIGFFSGIPHLISALSILVSSWLLDYLRSRKFTSKTKLHKMFILFGQVPGACLLIVVGYWNSFHFAMVAFSVFKICFSAAYVSYFVLPLDMSLEQTNMIISLGVTVKSIGTIINPIVMGFMVQNHLSEEWSRYFWFLSIFNVWGAVVFARFGSGEVQKWETVQESEDKKADSVNVSTM